MLNLGIVRICMRIKLTFTCEVDEPEGLFEDSYFESFRRTLESAIDSYSAQIPKNCILTQEEIKP